MKLVSVQILPLPLLVGFLVGLSRSATYKRKIGQAYLIDNTEVTGETVLSIVRNAKTKTECYLKCGRNSACIGFHYWPERRACQLLSSAPEASCTTELPGSPGVEYVKLESYPLAGPYSPYSAPWNAVGPRDQSIGAACWTWSYYDSSSALPADALMLFPDSGITVGSVYMYGAYVPAEFSTDDGYFRASLGTPYIDPVSFCNTTSGQGGYLFLNTGACSTSWEFYNRSEPLPPNAMVGGFDASGTPLFIVAVGEAIGNYNNVTDEALFFTAANRSSFNDTVVFMNPVEMTVLVEL